jgi:SAM-dependent methyltransferase
MAAGEANRSGCPACGGELVSWRSVPASEPLLGSTRFKLRQCVSCGSAVTVGGALADLHESGAYAAGTPRLYRVVRPLLRRFDRRRLALLAPFAPPPGRLLDIGAGRGRFVLAAGAAGYEARGIEPSERGVAAASQIGAPVERVSIESAELPAGGFDVITLWHVLEHLDDPGDALRRIGGWLRPGGTVLVGVPNLGSWQAGLGGERWYHLDVPRHRVHFTVTGVHALLRRGGFKVLGTHHRLAEHNPFGMWQSGVNRLTDNPSYLYNLLKRNAPVRSPDLLITAAAVPLAPVAALAELAAASAGAGGTLAVLARPARAASTALSAGDLSPVG